MGTLTYTGHIENACLQGIIRGRVRDLPGYTKPKLPLTNGSAWEQEFVQNAGASEVSAIATKIFDAMRLAFGFKRKELQFSCEGARACIQCPAFEYHVALEQDDKDAERYVLTQQIRSFQDADVIDDPRFLNVFANVCHAVVFQLRKKLDLEQAIDDIEEAGADAGVLTYDPNCTHFSLQLPNVKLHATATRLTFTLDRAGELSELLRFTRAAMDRLRLHHVAIGTRDA
jgi:hypothetical protein